MKTEKDVAEQTGNIFAEELCIFFLAACNNPILSRVTRPNTNNKAMFDFLMPLTIIGSFGASVYFFTKIITEYILKKKMIEKGYVNEDTQAIFKTRVSNEKHASLKWGLLSLSGGVSLILMDYLEVRSDSPLPYGLLAVALSVGFLTYYFVVKNDSGK